ncbi:MAG: HNH endonuclease [Bacteroidales bacterium]|nr:HNH endonuclease [Bacteroidales bacterium]
MSKITTSGTLWYTKKFLVYYYQIFLSNNITARNDVNFIRSIFDDYINSLPENIREHAINFFYSSNETADLRSDKFRLFDGFAGTIDFANANERNDYYEMAKKYYFAFLMESGGQSGINAHIKEKLYQTDFCFPQIDEIISDYYENESYNHSQIKNDYMAFLRNERQILFYYGFFHSKSSGSNDKEFSSLTPVGELALKSNFYEFLAIWEHQKIKMISQPVTVDVQNIKNQQFDANKFCLNLNPYLTILQWLKTKETFTNDEYQYIISRLREPLSDVSEINSLIENIDAIKSKVQSFNRKADVANEDFQKELKKYLLGIWADFGLDNNSNPLNVCKLKNRKVEIVNKDLLSSLVGNYTILAKYKAEKYANLFEKCQNEIRRQYKFGVSGEDYVIDGKIKVEWDMYNIHIELPILLSAIMQISQSILNVQFQAKNINNFADLIRKTMPNMLQYIGLSTKQSLIKELKSFQNTLETGNFEKYINVEQLDYELAVAKYQTDSAEDIKSKIETESNKPTIIIDGNKKRNHTLIHLIRAYNKKMFTQADILNCECCGETSFITFNDETYLEYHHLIPFSGYDGPDHYLNIYALCPSCHRKLHFIKQNYKRELYRQLSANNYIRRTIVQRLIDLLQSKKLRSYQLEFLLADDAITEEEYTQILIAA